MKTAKEGENQTKETQIPAPIEPNNGGLMAIETKGIEFVDDDGEIFENVETNVEQFEIVKLEKEGDKFKGYFLGDYAQTCEAMGAKSKNKIKGWLFVTPFGLKLVSNYHAIDQKLLKVEPNSSVLIIRGKNEYNKGADPQTAKPKYVNFTVLVGKRQ